MVSAKPPLCYHSLCYTCWHFIEASMREHRLESAVLPGLSKLAVEDCHSGALVHWLCRCHYAILCHYHITLNLDGYNVDINSPDGLLVNNGVFPKWHSLTVLAPNALKNKHLFCWETQQCFQCSLQQFKDVGVIHKERWKCWFVVVCVQSLLVESQEPLSFIVFIPDWRDPPTEALIRVESSR